MIMERRAIESVWRQAAVYSLGTATRRSHMNRCVVFFVPPEFPEGRLLRPRPAAQQYRRGRPIVGCAARRSARRLCQAHQLDAEGLASQLREVRQMPLQTAAVVAQERALGRMLG